VSDKRRDADIDSLTDNELLELADTAQSVPMATPVFDGAAEEKLSLCDLLISRQRAADALRRAIR